MKVVHAHWDDISLGVKSFEVDLNREDTLKDFLSEEKRLIQNEGAEYITVKTLVGVQDHLFGLIQAGYSFIETGFLLSLKKKNYVSPKIFDRFDSFTKVRQLKGVQDTQHVFDEIHRGIFEVDRISIDKHFSQELGNQRYVNWITSLIEKGFLIQEVTVKEVPTGFFILEPLSEKKIRGILTGTYRQEAGSGIIVMKKLKEYVWKNGYETYLAQVSSNNLRALRANLLFGSEIENLSYTYVKHIEQGESSNERV